MMREADESLLLLIFGSESCMAVQDKRIHRGVQENTGGLQLSSEDSRVIPSPARGPVHGWFQRKHLRDSSYHGTTN